MEATSGTSQHALGKRQPLARTPAEDEAVHPPMSTALSRQPDAGRPRCAFVSQRASGARLRELANAHDEKPIAAQTRNHHAARFPQAEKSWNGSCPAPLRRASQPSARLTLPRVLVSRWPGRGQRAELLLQGRFHRPFTVPSARPGAPGNVTLRQAASGPQRSCRASGSTARLRRAPHPRAHGC